MNTEGITLYSTELDREFFHKYVSVMGDEWFESYRALTLGLIQMLYIPKEVIDDWDRKEAEYRAFNERLNRTASLNNKGISLEKEGKIPEAIAVYEENIADGYKAAHSYNRLMILYRRQKEYNQELRVIDRTLEVYGTGAELRWRKRREKVLQLIAKTAG